MDPARLLFLRWGIKWRDRFKKALGVEVSAKGVGKFFAGEILSVGVTSGLAFGLLEYHRFKASLIMFSIACAAAAVQLLVPILAIQILPARAVGVAIVYVAAILSVSYLTGIVNQAETEYFTASIRADVEASNASVKQIPRKEVIVELKDDHQTKPAVKVKTIPKPNKEPPPVQVVVAADPYAGYSNQQVSQWAVEEADRMDGMGQTCQQELVKAIQRKGQGTPPAPFAPGPQMVQAQFRQQFDEVIKPAITKLHDSITLRLGPAALVPYQERDYQDTVNFESDPRESWPLCDLVQSYASDLRKMAITLNARP